MNRAFPFYKNNIIRGYYEWDCVGIKKRGFFINQGKNLAHPDRSGWGQFLTKNEGKRSFFAIRLFVITSISSALISMMFVDTDFVIAPTQVFSTYKPISPSTKAFLQTQQKALFL